jgi:hypothetical protein
VFENYRLQLPEGYDTMMKRYSLIGEFSMLISVYVILLVAVCFAAMIIQLAAKPAFSAKLTGTLIVIAAISGFFFYGYGFSYMEPNPLIAVIRGLLGVFYMFLGRTDFTVVSATPLNDVALAAPLFWLVHLAAFYATASATITAIGAEALKKMPEGEEKQKAEAQFSENEKKFLEANEQMVKVYGYSIARDYLMEIAVSKLYTKVTEEEFLRAEAQKELEDETLTLEPAK